MNYRTWDTIKQASGALNVPQDLLKKAKAAGCPAFRGSRIYEEDLAPWLEANREKIAAKRSKEDVQIEKLLEECRKLKLQNDIKAKEVLPQKQVAEANNKAASKMRLFLYQKLCNEIPAESREFGIKTYDEFCAMVQQFASLWDGEKS